jgi:hypothetical protein
MRIDTRLTSGLALLALAASMATLAPADVLADARCGGHKLLSKPRAEGSCRYVVPWIFVSPDKEMRALVYPADVLLDTTPDMESRVVIRSSAGDTITSMDHSSPRGMNGYYVYRAKWSPDSQFFVYSLVSSGGHSPWSFPIMVFDRKSAAIAKFSDMLGGKPTLSGDFNFSAPHTLNATTWKRPGAAGEKELGDKIPVTVDLQEAFKKLPSSE